MNASSLSLLEYGGFLRFVKLMADVGDQAGGAGEGNRTLVVSLGSFCSAIELHPQLVDLTRIVAATSQRVYSQVYSLC